MRKEVLRRMLAVAGASLALSLPAQAQRGGDDFAPFDKVSEGYSQVVSTADGASSLYTLWVRNKDGQMLAELPRNFERQNILLTSVIKEGDQWAGYQATGAEIYCYWKRFDDRLALMEKNFGTRSSGDAESKASVGRHFKDRVLLDVPIVSFGPSGGPVIDLDGLLIQGAGNFFGPSAAGLNPRLTDIVKAKAFPTNVEIAFEAPVRGGNLVTFAYSLREVPENTGYRPREADERVGYFTTFYRDLGKYNNEEKWIRYINRWNLEKRDARLKLSPPKEPIVFYIEHTVPVRYRNAVREGVEYWNKAFERVGIRNAIEVYQQDKATGAHMDKDPEDSRYNFLLWLSNDISTAIGPSRTHPKTGEILDADIVLTDGWLRVFKMQWEDVMSQTIVDGMSAETLAWLETKPQWDPRVRMADPAKFEQMKAEREAKIARGEGFEELRAQEAMMSWNGFDFGGDAALRQCQSAQGKAYAMTLMRTHLEMMQILKQLEMGETEPEGEVLDGVPEEFVAPLLADLVAHEVGHTLGLRHNFKASSVYTLDEINSEELKGKKTWSTSVMDYHPLNVNMDPDAIQGDYAPIAVGEYDMWAIEYGYTFDKPEEVLKRANDPMHTYGTDEDTGGPDPLARRYDLTKHPIDYARAKVQLAQFYRDRLLDEYVKDGDSWAKARRGYTLSLSEQVGAMAIMANWIGGADVNRLKKGDAEGVTPITPIDADVQREALDFVIENAFFDEAFGLDSEMLRYMTVDKWFDPGGDANAEPTWAIHDRVLGIQASMLTQIMNPTTLRRVYDNEFLVEEGEDALTLPEVFSTVDEAMWVELDKGIEKRYTARSPMISSLRRNLQSEYVDRLIDLTLPGAMFGAAAKPVSNLALHELTELHKRLGKMMESSSIDRLDPYTSSHLNEIHTRIGQALDAKFIYNN